ncbi:MAG: glutamine--tRNA ligase, partial [Bacillota bacterium]|nr:glutamine--tRNA ligase [Bacillota bacterium]
LAEAKPGDRLQFMRQGYFFVDPVDAKEGQLAFNRIVGLKDNWSKGQNS